MGTKKTIIQISQIENIDDCVEFSILKPLLDTRPKLAEELISKSARARQIQLVVLDLSKDTDNEEEKNYRVLYGQSKLYAYMKLGINKIPVTVSTKEPPIDKIWRDLFESDFMSLNPYEKGKLLAKLIHDSGSIIRKAFSQYSLPVDSSVMTYYAYKTAVEYPEIKVAYMSYKLSANIVCYTKKLYEAAERCGCRRELSRVLTEGGNPAGGKAAAVFKKTHDIKKSIECAESILSDNLFKGMNESQINAAKIEMSRFFIPGYYSREVVAPEVEAGIKLAVSERADLDLLKTYLLLRYYCGLDIDLSSVRLLNSENDNIAKKFMFRFSNYLTRLDFLVFSFPEVKDDVFKLVSSPNDIFAKRNKERLSITKKLRQEANWIGDEINTIAHSRQVATRFYLKIKTILQSK